MAIPATAPADLTHARACLRCSGSIPADCSYCPACGAWIAQPGLPGDRRIEAKLAEANLFRIRQQWQDAEARCIEVLRVDPDDIHAHSLLGDVFRDQGRMQDAARWYQMALDLAPDSSPDRAKLARAESASAPPAQRDPLGTVAGTQKLLGLPPSLWLRGVTAISVVFVVLVVAIAIATRGGTHSEGVSGTLPGSTSSASLSGPTPSAGSPPADSGTGPYPSAQSSARPQSQQQPAGPQGVYTERELRLQGILSRTAELADHAIVAAVSIDPREQRASIILVCSEGAAEAGTIREQVVRAAFGAARAALTGDVSLQRVSVSARVAGPSGRAEPAFSGDMDRADVQRADGSASADHLAATFADVWWDPSLVASDSSGPAGSTSGSSPTGP